MPYLLCGTLRLGAAERFPETAFSCYSKGMGEAFSQEMRLSARAVQVQSQRMSQQQIMSLNVLALAGVDLRDEIYAQAAKNPALEVVRDNLAAGARTARAGQSRFSDDARYASVTAAGERASDVFQAALESRADERETLREHLERQFNSVRRGEDETTLGLRLIRNLDARGFHLLAPVSLLDKENPAHTADLLESCMETVRALDPVGTCTSGVEESLLVQARIRGDAPRAALFLLDGHLDLLSPPQSAKVAKKIEAFLRDRASRSFGGAEQADTPRFSEEDIAEAIAYIRTLDPYPARNFGAGDAPFIVPDVYVERIPPEEADEAKGIVEAGALSFKVTLARDVVPRLAVSKEFAAFPAQDDKPQTERQKAERRFVRDAVRDAKVFIESVQFREATIARAVAEIVRRQARFFAEGPRFLAPLRQKDLAESLGVHEATVSRMANGKYVQCEWGLFALGYFFTNAVGGAEDAADGGQGARSKESVKYEIAQLLRAHRDDKKPLSDQKIADALAAKGIAVARRTVAKYRAELHIGSSYGR